MHKTGRRCNYLFLLPPNQEELRKRLVARGTETDASLEKRLENAKKEETLARESGIFQKFIVNDDLQTFLCEVKEYVEGLYFLKGADQFQAAGHAGSFKFDGAILRKLTSEAEANNYKAANSEPSQALDEYSVEMRKLRSLMPKFHSIEKQADSKKWQLAIENCLAFDGKPSETCSFMDIKLGTSTLTINGEAKGADFIANRQTKDEKTTSATLGFVICGYLIKDSNGSNTDSGYKVHTKITQDTVVPTLRKILVDDKGKLMKEVKDSILKELRFMAKIFSDVNLEIRGASVFIAVDKVTRKVNVKLIDIGSAKLINGADKGFNFGLDNLLKHLQQCE